MTINRKIAGVVAITFAMNTPIFAQAEHIAARANMNTVFAEDLINVGQEHDLRAQLKQKLDDAAVVAKLEKMGVNKSEAESRLAAMSDNELSQIAQNVHREAGGDVVVISVGAALLIILLLVILLRPSGGGGSTTVVK